MEQRIVLQIAIVQLGKGSSEINVHTTIRLQCSSGALARLLHELATKLGTKSQHVQSAKCLIIVNAILHCCALTDHRDTKRSALQFAQEWVPWPASDLRRLTGAARSISEYDDHLLKEWRWTDTRVHAVVLCRHWVDPFASSFDFREMLEVLPHQRFLTITQEHHACFAAIGRQTRNIA